MKNQTFHCTYSVAQEFNKINLQTTVYPNTPIHIFVLVCLL